jgi:hypothetical protein
MIVDGLLAPRRDGPPDAQKEARAECVPLVIVDNVLYHF